jgi:hypothetical protein
MSTPKAACYMLLGLLITAPFASAEQQAQISRLPPLPQPLDPILQDMFEKRRAMGGAIINLALTTGHAPKFAGRPEPWRLQFVLRPARRAG